MEIVFSKEKQEQNLQIDFNNKSLKLSKPVFRNNSFHKSKTFQEEYQTQFFPSVSKIKKSLTKPNISISGSFSKYSQNQNLQLKNKSFDEIQSPSKLVEKIYTNMNSNCKEGEKSNSLIKPKKIEYSIDSTTKKDKIISKGTMPGKKELRNCKYSNLKKKFIKEYFYPKEENQGSEKKEEICTNHFDQVIFNDLSAAALASHKWRKKTAQNNAYLMKSFSPEIIDYPNSPKFSQYNAFIRNFGRVQNSHKHCISNQVENKQLINNSSEIKTPNEQYLKQISQKEKEYQKVYGMNFNEYEDVIKLWEIDHLKSELPNIGQAYQYMKIIKSNNASKQISNKNKTKTPSKKKDLSSEKKIFVISPKTTNRSGLNLKPKKDILEVNNISSPTDKINHHTFFSPNSFKKRSPRFSIRSSNRYLTKSIEPSKCEQIEFSSFQFL